jgi:predicted acetyltransferase
MDLETERSAFVRGYAPSGRVVMHREEEAIPRILEVHAEVRRTRPGMPFVDERWLEYNLGHHHPKDDPRPFLAVHETEGVPDGYAVYRVKHAWPGSMPQTVLEVSDLMATTPRAYADMWRFVLDVDLVHRVTAWARPVDEPLLHLLAEPRRLRLTVKDALWIRPIDVRAALTGRSYASQGRIVIELEDAFCPWNEGRWSLDVSPDGATCEPTDDDADLACDVNVLGAVYLGGSAFRQLWRAGRVEELHPGALQRADALVAWEPAPWCSFIF